MSSSPSSRKRSRSTSGGGGRRTRPKPADHAQRSDEHFQLFFRKLKTTIALQWPSGIKHEDAARLMWQKHKERGRLTCSQNCPCVYELPFLTGSVISEHRRKHLTWTYKGPIVEFTTEFAKSVMPVVRQNHPGQTPAFHLSRLVELFEEAQNHVGDANHENESVGLSTDRYEEHFQSFFHKMKPAIALQWPSGIDHESAARLMWQRHKERRRLTCPPDCPCVYELPYLTENVLFEHKRKHPTWDYTGPTNDLSTDFARRIMPLIRNEHTDRSPEWHLQRLVHSWARRQAKIAKHQNEESEEESEDEPQMDPSEEKGFNHFSGKMMQIVRRQWPSSGIEHETIIRLMWQRHKERGRPTCFQRCACIYDIPYMMETVMDDYKRKHPNWTYTGSRNDLIASFAPRELTRIRQKYPDKPPIFHLYRLLDAWDGNQAELDPREPDKGAAVRENRTDQDEKAFQGFFRKMKRLIALQWPCGIQHEATARILWDKHRERGYTHCSKDCTCVYDLPELTRDVLSEYARIYPNWTYMGPKNDLTTDFAARVLPLIRKQHPDLSPLLHMRRLIGSWERHHEKLRVDGRVAGPKLMETTQGQSDMSESDGETPVDESSSDDDGTDRFQIVIQPVSKTPDRSPDRVLSVDPNVEAPPFYFNKVREVIEIQWPKGIKQGFAARSMWLKHRQLGYNECSDECPCVYQLRFLTKDVLSDNQRRDPTWQYRGPKVRFADLFSKQMMPRIQQQYPGESPAFHLQKLIDSWNERRGRQSSGTASSTMAVSSKSARNEDIERGFSDDHPIRTTFVVAGSSGIQHSVHLSDSGAAGLVDSGPTHTGKGDFREETDGPSIPTSRVTAANGTRDSVYQRSPRDELMPTLVSSCPLMDGISSFSPREPVQDRETGSGAQENLSVGAEAGFTSPLTEDLLTEGASIPFQRKMHAIVNLQWPVGVDLVAALGLMWKKHKELGYVKCFISCPCAYDLPYLTCSVISDMERDIADWTYTGPVNDLTLSFAEHNMPKIRQRHPTHPPEYHLGKLITAWTRHHSHIAASTLANHLTPSTPSTQLPPQDSAQGSVAMGRVIPPGGLLRGKDTPSHAALAMPRPCPTTESATEPMEGHTRVDTTSVPYTAIPRRQPSTGQPVSLIAHALMSPEHEFVVSLDPLQPLGMFIVPHDDTLVCYSVSPIGQASADDRIRPGNRLVAATVSSKRWDLSCLDILREATEAAKSQRTTIEIEFATGNPQQGFTDHDTLWDINGSWCGPRMASGWDGVLPDLSGSLSDSTDTHSPTLREWKASLEEKEPLRTAWIPLPGQREQKTRQLDNVTATVCPDDLTHAVPPPQKKARSDRWDLASPENPGLDDPSSSQTASIGFATGVASEILPATAPVEVASSTSGELPNASDATATGRLSIEGGMWTERTFPVPATSTLLRKHPFKSNMLSTNKGDSTQRVNFNDVIEERRYEKGCRSNVFLLHGDGDRSSTHVDTMQQDIQVSAVDQLEQLLEHASVMDFVHILDNGAAREIRKDSEWKELGVFLEDLIQAAHHDVQKNPKDSKVKERHTLMLAKKSAFDSYMLAHKILKVARTMKYWKRYEVFLVEIEDFELKENALSISPDHVLHVDVSLVASDKRWSEPLLSPPDEPLHSDHGEVRDYFPLRPKAPHDLHCNTALEPTQRIVIDLQCRQKSNTSKSVSLAHLEVPLADLSHNKQGAWSVVRVPATENVFLKQANLRLRVRPMVADMAFRKAIRKQECLRLFECIQQVQEFQSLLFHQWSITDVTIPPNLPVGGGLTLLHTCIYLDEKPLVQLLLQNGADPKRRSQVGSALQLAMTLRDEQKFLEAHSANAAHRRKRYDEIVRILEAATG